MIGRHVAGAILGAALLTGVASAQETQIWVQSKAFGTTEGALDEPGAWIRIRSVQYGVSAGESGPAASELVLIKDAESTASPKIAGLLLDPSPIVVRIAFVRAGDKPVEIARFELEGVRVVRLGHSASRPLDALVEEVSLRYAAMNFRSTTLGGNGSALLERDGRLEPTNSK